MFDIHYHLLFGTDDGPKTIEDSIALAEASIEEGVTHIVATPHANGMYAFDAAANREKLAEIEQRLAGGLKLGLGCDFHLSYENIEDLRRDPTRYTINGLRYLLVEFSDFGISPLISDTFHDMQVNGVVPIITHPERNALLATSPQRMAEWLRGGCLIQVTAASLTGRFGRKAESAARDLIKKNWVHIVASDAHSIAGRPPSMREAHRLLANDYGEETADRLCIHNPRAVFYGESLGPQPDPVGVFDNLKPRKAGLLKRVFGGK